jgi:hypothetical protein
MVANPGPSIGDVHGEIANALKSAGRPDRWSFFPAELAPVTTTLANMPRWLEIRFPRSLANEVGQFGISVSTARLFSWIASDVSTDESRAEYFARLAHALEDGDGPCPYIENNQAERVAKLEAFTELRKWAATAGAGLSEHGIAYLKWKESSLVREVFEGGSGPYLDFSLPADLLPPWLASSDLEAGMRVPVGLALTYMAEEMEGENSASASQLRWIVDGYYVDDEVEIEVNVPDGHHFWLIDIVSEKVVQRLWNGTNLEAISGSVQIDNFGHNSIYSSDSTKYPYKVFKFYDAEGDENDGCLLISEKRILGATISRD